MVVDTSALAAIMLREPERPAFVRAVHERPCRLSAASYLEVGIVLVRRRGPEALGDLDRFIERADMEVVSVDRPQATLAREAYLRFGKGRHPAGLNFGDCFAYALAKQLDAPLLFKGEDFARTDIRPAVTLP